MIGEALLRGEEVLVVIAECLRARQQRHSGRGREFGDRARDPFGGAAPVDGRLRLGEQRAAEFRLLVEQDDAGARPRRGQSRRQAGRARADDRDFAVPVLEAVMVGVRVLRSDPEAGRATDRRLVEVLPGALRADEGLVVEADGKQRRGKAVDRHRIPLQRRPGVLRARLQALVELDLRRAQIGRDATLARVERDQRVRLVRPQRERTARPMVLERAPHQMNAVGDERGGERIAGEAVVGLAVEEERDRLRAIDAPARGRAELARHAGRRNRSHESAISASFRRADM